MNKYKFKKDCIPYGMIAFCLMISLTGFASVNWEFDSAKEAADWTFGKGGTGLVVQSSIDGGLGVMTSLDITGGDPQLTMTVHPTTGGHLWNELEVRLRQISKNPGERGTRAVPWSDKGTTLQVNTKRFGRLLTGAKSVEYESGHWVRLTYDISFARHYAIDRIRLDPLTDPSKNFEIDYIRLTTTEPPVPAATREGLVCYDGTIRDWGFEERVDDKGLNRQSKLQRTVVDSADGPIGVLAGTRSNKGQVLNMNHIAFPAGLASWDRLLFRMRHIGSDGAPISYRSEGEYVEVQTKGSSNRARFVSRRQEDDGWVTVVYDISSAGRDDIKTIRIAPQRKTVHSFQLDYLRLSGKPEELNVLCRVIRSANVPRLAPYTLQSLENYGLTYWRRYNPKSWDENQSNQRYILDHIESTPVNAPLDVSLRTQPDSSLAPDFNSLDRVVSWNARAPIDIPVINLWRSGNSSLGPLKPDEFRQLKADTLAYAKAQKIDLPRVQWSMLARMPQWQEGRRRELTDLIDEVDAYRMEVGLDLACDLRMAYDRGNWSKKFDQKTLQKYLDKQNDYKEKWLGLRRWARANNKQIFMSCTMNGLRGPLATHDVITPLKQMIFWMEDHDVLPNMIEPIWYPSTRSGIRHPDKELDKYPEAVFDDATQTARPANTILGAVFWLHRHRDAQPGELDLSYSNRSGKSFSEGVASPVPTHPSQNIVLSGLKKGKTSGFVFGVKNRSQWMEYTAVVRVAGKKSGWQIEIEDLANQERLDEACFSPDGLVLNGKRRLMPSTGENSATDFKAELLITKLNDSPEPLDLLITVHSHSDSVAGALDVLRVTAD